MMNWNDTGYSYEIGVNIVNQHNVEDTLGSLTGVQITGMSITENYYSDSRVQAKIKTVVKEGETDGYIENARLRVILSIPDRLFFEELVTGYVSDIDEVHDKGYIQKTYTVEGTIWGLLDHLMADPVIIGTGAKMIDMWEQLMLFQTRMQYNTEGAQDRSFEAAAMYEAGTSLATILFDISSGYSRMSVNGHGVVTLRKYTPPSQMEASRTLDYNDIRGLAITPLTKTSAKYNSPGRIVVTATVSRENNGEYTQEVISGHYDSPDSEPTSMAVRGYLTAKAESYSNTGSEPTVSDLNALAEAYWRTAQDKGVEWTGSTVFADYHAGEVINLAVPVGFGNSSQNSIIKVLVSQVNTNLDNMVQELTLKEV